MLAHSRADRQNWPQRDIAEITITPEAARRITISERKVAHHIRRVHYLPG
jgi:hypothetical protein